MTLAGAGLVRGLRSYQRPLRALRLFVIEFWVIAHATPPIAAAVIIVKTKIIMFPVPAAS